MTGSISPLYMHHMISTQNVCYKVNLPDIQWKATMEYFVEILIQHLIPRMTVTDVLLIPIRDVEVLSFLGLKLMN